MYVYLREAYSPLWGFLYGWTLFTVIQTGTIAAVAVACARFTGVLVPAISEDRYLIPPVEFVRVQRDADARGLDIVGFYHSHPDHPAQPSAFDQAHAWPGYAYLITAIAHGEPRDLRGFRLDHVGGAFSEIVLEEA